MKTDKCSTVADCSTSKNPSVADQNIISPSIDKGCSTVADKKTVLTGPEGIPSLNEALDRLKQISVKLDLVQGKVRYRGPIGSISPEIMAVLRSRKMELLKILESESNPGKVLINGTLNQIADAWSQIETSGGSIAWEWILRGSPYGAKIRQAEGLVNAIGSKGNPAALEAACAAWFFSWLEGIEAWKRHFSSMKGSLQSKNEVKQ